MVPCFDGEAIGMKLGSKLCNAPTTCWKHLDFTYFSPRFSDYSNTTFPISIQCGTLPLTAR